MAKNTNFKWFSFKVSNSKFQLKNCKEFFLLYKIVNSLKCRKYRNFNICRTYIFIVLCHNIFQYFIKNWSKTINSSTSQSNIQIFFLLPSLFYGNFCHQMENLNLISGYKFFLWNHFFLIDNRRLSSFK